MKRNRWGKESLTTQLFFNLKVEQFTTTQPMPGIGRYSFFQCGRRYKMNILIVPEIG